MKRSIDSDTEEVFEGLGADGLIQPTSHSHLSDGGFNQHLQSSDIDSHSLKRQRLDNNDDDIDAANDTDDLDASSSSVPQTKPEHHIPQIDTPPVSTTQDDDFAHTHQNDHDDDDDDDFDAVKPELLQPPLQPLPESSSTSQQFIPPSQPIPQSSSHQSEVAPAPPAAPEPQPAAEEPSSKLDPSYVSTPLDKHQLKHCRQVIARAKRLKDALLFLQPVDPVKLGIPTYFHFVKRPMDLSTIQKKLDTGVYRVATECVDDLLLMIQNCWLFNGKESAVGGIATNLWRYFEKELVAKMPQHLEVKRPSSSAGHGHYAAPAPIERPKRDVQPPPRINSMDLQGVSPTRKPFSKQALSDLKFAAQLVRELMKPKYYTFAYPFLTPVDWVALQIPTYPHIIKHPMDFGTILKRLDQGHYTNGSEFEADSRLVFRNCYTFNAVGSDVYEMGRKLEQVFDLKWRERPIVKSSGGSSASALGRGYGNVPVPEDSDSSSSEEEQEDLNKMQENLLKLMQEVTKLAAHKGTKKKDKHKKHKMHALLQQQALTAAIAGAASSSSLLSSHPSLSTTSSSAPSKKKKKSSSSSHRSSRPPAAPAVRDISYQQKKELSEKIELLSPDKLEGVYQIIRNGMPSLDSQAAGQDEIELDIDSLDKVTLSRLYHFVINAATGRPVTSAPPPVSAPKSLSTANGNASSSDSDDSGSDSDSGSSGSSSSSGSNSSAAAAASDSDSDSVFVGGAEVLGPEDDDDIFVPPASAPVTVTAPAPPPVVVAPPVPVTVTKPVSAQPAASMARSKTMPTKAATTAAPSSSTPELTTRRPELKDLKFKKADPKSIPPTQSTAPLRKTASSVAPPPPAPKPLDVLGYADEVATRAKKEEERLKKIKMEAERNREQKAQLDLKKQKDERAASETQLTPREREYMMRQIPSAEERELAYKKSVEKYVGHYLDLHRQGTKIQEFEEVLRMETVPSSKFEAQLARDRAELLADVLSNSC